MSNRILVLAPTGIGKTTAERNLIPACTGIINCDKKELPFRGWRKNYVTAKDTAGRVDLAASNYIETNKAKGVLLALEAWEKSTQIKNITIDTITHMITQEYMVNAIGKDFKAYQALGKTYYDIVEFIASSTKNIIVNAHVEKRLTETGEYVWEMKSHGKMISDLVPPSYFTTVLMGEKHKVGIDEKTGQPLFKFVFRTQSEGNDPAKSPAYVDDSSGTPKVETALEYLEPNDIAVILEKLDLFGAGA